MSDEFRASLWRITFGITGPPRLMLHLKTRHRRLRVHAFVIRWVSTFRLVCDSLLPSPGLTISSKTGQQSKPSVESPEIMYVFSEWLTIIHSSPISSFSGIQTTLVSSRGYCVALANKTRWPHWWNSLAIVFRRHDWPAV